MPTLRRTWTVPSDTNPTKELVITLTDNSLDLAIQDQGQPQARIPLGPTGQDALRTAATEALHATETTTQTQPTT